MLSPPYISLYDRIEEFHVAALNSDGRLARSPTIRDSAAKVLD
jgi:hypothetical protein